MGLTLTVERGGGVGWCRLRVVEVVGGADRGVEVLGGADRGVEVLGGADCRGEREEDKAGLGRRVVYPQASSMNTGWYNRHI